MHNKGVFITGTDTDVGKTRVATAIASELTLRGLTVIPKKPIESGCLNQDGELIPRDAMALIKATHYRGLLSDVCRYPFEPAISPVRAASLVNKTVTTEQLVAACNQDSGQRDDEKDFMLVEGAGGFYSPLTTDGLNADLAVALQLPVVLVAENKLGVIGQVLLNAEAIDRRGMRLACVILNTCKPDATKPETAEPNTAEPDAAKNEQNHHMDNTTDIQQRLSCPVFATPYAENGNVELAEAVIDTIIDAAITRSITHPAITDTSQPTHRD